MKNLLHYYIVDIHQSFDRGRESKGPFILVSLIKARFNEEIANNSRKLELGLERSLKEFGVDEIQMLCVFYLFSWLTLEAWY